jgi:hypothetical protein
MWRRFLWFGIPMLVFGGTVLCVNAVRVLDGIMSGSHPPVVLLVAACAVTGTGFLLVNAGLIGAAVGADPRTHELAERGEPRSRL